MNRQIVKLFAFIVVLFAVLVAFTSYWSVFDAKALKEEEANKRPLLEQQQIRRGRILAADGTVIAVSRPKGRGASLRYVRHYPEGALFGHPIGYSYVRQGDSEFEQYHNAELVGEESEFNSILDELTGRNKEGDDVVTNLDTEAQRVALADLEEAGFGAVVAIEPSTGAVKVMASNKPYDPNRIPYELGKLNLNRVETPLLNRATQGLYPPGSTFKVVTAAAGLESGVITPETTINAPGTILDEGIPLANDFNQNWGEISLDTALTNSVNTWFGQLGQRVGQSQLFETMEKFGFGSTPPIDLPSDEVYTSGVYGESGVLGRNDPVDLARVAIGQERLLATPLQIAMVAAAIANGGRLMKPQIWNRVVDPDGRTVKHLEPAEYSRPVSARTAEEL
ncbi:MAG: penicillin-binding transpeptidase domain-containing protein, partial [Syntrophothermus sp.]